MNTVRRNYRFITSQSLQFRGTSPMSVDFVNVSAPRLLFQPCNVQNEADRLFSIILYDRIQVDQHEYLNRSGQINAFYGRISVNIQWSGPEVTTVDVKSSRSKRSKIQIIFSSLYIKPVSFFSMFLSPSMFLLKEQILGWNTVFYRPKGVT